ncbi:penicillin-binding protein activator, partial [Salmonella enterica subsp. enterica serovar Infantis]
QQSADDSKTNWQLLAIDALQKEGKSQQAVDLFNQLPHNLNDTQRREQSLLAVELKLAQKDVAGAQALLDQLKPADFAP